MNGHIYYSAGHTDALDFAVKALKRKGCVFAKQPDKTVTRLLLPVPSFDTNGCLKGGGMLAEVLEHLSRNVTIYCGNPGHFIPPGYKTVDLLQDAFFLAENADITAHCAVREAILQLTVTLRGCHVLVVGWGRIGKCLSSLLKSMGAIVTVAARKEQDRAIAAALGYDVTDVHSLSYELLRFQVIFNTVPETVITKDAIKYCRPDCLKIDLASVPGIDAPDVISARGLPNKDAPESSGELIARTVLRLGAF